jgi:1-acyl-sn-glycerol-3-phosphate acyltransferase
MIKSLSRFFLSIFGWKTSHTVKLPDKCVLIGAPHTSNWDFPLTLLGLSSMGVKFNWVAKHTLFFWPLGSLLRAIGGISVDRSQGTSFLKRIIELYDSQEKIVLAIAPEGTRSKTRYWKTGFYTIAHRAGVPIGFGYIDYPRKIIGLDKVITPTGDINQDFEIIKEYYQNKTGRYPEKQGDIRIKVRKKKSIKENEQPGDGE